MNEQWMIKILDIIFAINTAFNKAQHLRSDAQAYWTMSIMQAKDIAD